MRRILFLGLLTMGSLTAACETSARDQTSNPDTGPAFHTTESGLQYAVLRAGEGPKPIAGQTVHVHESVYLASGVLVLSTRDAGRPVSFRLGQGHVIDAVEEAVADMRAGEVRKLLIPPSLSQRESYPEGLSEDEALVYDIELVEIEDSP